MPDWPTYLATHTAILFGTGTDGITWLRADSQDSALWNSAVVVLTTPVALTKKARRINICDAPKENRVPPGRYKKTDLPVTRQRGDSSTMPSDKSL